VQRLGQEGLSVATAADGTGLVLSCEHGGNAVPAEYAGLFEGHEALLASHRGWDPGTLELAQQMASELGAPLHASTTTRLLVDLNRSSGHRELFSALAGRLSRGERDTILAAHYQPHRDALERDIASRIAAGQRIVHVALHSFVPVLGGRVRHADVACLYDPKRAGEAALTQRWLAALAAREGSLLLRRNYPYRGSSDGLTKHLRERFDARDYVGIELEVNQRFVDQGGPAWAQLRADLIASLAEAMGLELA